MVQSMDLSFPRCWEQHVAVGCAVGRACFAAKGPWCFRKYFWTVTEQ